MDNTQKEKIIRTYFNMCVELDFSEIEAIFTNDIYYSESCGPEYHGLEDIYQWMNDLVEKRRVLEWRIKRFIHENETVVVEWFFKERQNGAVHGFDGVSIIEFMANGKIASIKEFGSQSEHVTPDY